MKLVITDGEIGVRPPVAKPHPGFFDEVGEERFKKLVYDHYELIEESDIAFLFPVHDEDDFEDAKRHAFSFLVEVCGGPDYFTQERGNHQMVGRHAPFRIDEAGRKSCTSHPDSGQIRSQRLREYGGIAPAISRNG